MTILTILSDVRRLIVLVYSFNLPQQERYGLESQIRRAVVSVALNIREGNVFRDKNKVKFFMQAKGSLEEAEECILILNQLNYITPFDKNDFDIEYWVCFNKLNKLINSITQHVQNGQDAHALNK